MTLIEKIKQIANASCPEYSFAYDIRNMLNIDADDIKFPAICMEEFYGCRLFNSYGWKKQVTIELHFLNLCDMHGEGMERERIRALLMQAITTFIAGVNADGTFSEVTDVTADPEPPLFDSNCTGVLLRMTLTYPVCEIL